VLNLRRSTLSILCTSLAVGATGLGSGVAAAGASSKPSALTQPATGVGPRSAVLQGIVNPNDETTTYRFWFGPTGASPQPTPLTSLNKGKNNVPVSYAVTGLVPATTYHVWVYANNNHGDTLSADVTFTTPAEPTGGSAPAPTAPPAPGTPTTPGSAPAAAPELGHTVNVKEAAGSVFVRVPGAASAVPLSGLASVPVGAILDTRQGTVELETALPGTGTQSATFHGGVFSVRQSSTGSGMTELVLRGPKPSCHTADARAAATSKPPPARTLWGNDHHGRFRTRGSNSVATVRGTSWYMADRCDGTYTRVKHGSVAVRDLRSGHTIVLHAGQSHLAPAPH
jgi:hypothetical protein